MGKVIEFKRSTDKPPCPGAKPVFINGQHKGWLMPSKGGPTNG